MKQLLIVKSTETALRTTMQNVINNPGSLGLFKFSLDGNGKQNPVSGSIASLTENFTIYLGRPNGQMPFSITEVDYKTLTYEKATPSQGTYFKLVFRMPLKTEIGEEYTLVLAKKGTVPNERNTWTYTHLAKTKDGAKEAEAFADEINAKFMAMSSPFNAAYSETTETINEGTDDEETVNVELITITGTELNDGYTARFADRLMGTKVIEYSTLANNFVPDEGEAGCVVGHKNILDKAYIQDLASRCAAGKGFTETYRADHGVLPGYPEEVDSNWYVLYTLRFQVGRDSAKTRDEKVWQIVHIAVPSTSSGTGDMVTALDTIFV